jgi:LysM repeat protein
MKSNSRRPARSARLAAAIARDDPFGMEVEKGPGFGRVIFIFLLLHAIGIGGFAAYKWINPDEPVAETKPATTASTDAAKPKERPQSSSKLDVDELLAPRRTTGTPMVLDHPEMPGFKRYRVGEGERLVEIVRQFHASVAEVEKLNGLKPGETLVTGQWLTIPDNTGNGMPLPAGEEATPVKAKVVDPKAAPKPITPSVVESKATAKTEPESAAVEPAKPVERPPVRKVEAASPKPSVEDQLQPRPPKALPVKSYRVVKGDTAYSIARRYNVDWQELLRVNGMNDPRQLRADQVIRIP